MMVCSRLAELGEARAIGPAHAGLCALCSDPQLSLEAVGAVKGLDVKER